MKVTLRSVKKVVVLLQLSLLGLMAGASFASGQDEKNAQDLPEGAQYLPAGEGRTLMLQGCVQCHDLRKSVSQRKTAAGWRRTVDEMISSGAPLLTDEAETITRYLGEAFGPGQP